MCLQCVEQGGKRVGVKACSKHAFRARLGPAEKHDKKDSSVSAAINQSCADSGSDRQWPTAIARFLEMPWPDTCDCTMALY